MKSATQLEQELGRMAQDSFGVTEKYLDYAKSYKEKTDEWVERLLAEEFQDVVHPDVRLVVALSTNESPKTLKAAIAKIKSEIKPDQIIYDKPSGRIFIWRNEAATPHGA